MLLLLMFPPHIILVILYYYMHLFLCVVMHIHVYIPRVSVEVGDRLWGRFRPPTLWVLGMESKPSGDKYLCHMSCLTGPRFVFCWFGFCFVFVF